MAVIAHSQQQGNGTRARVLPRLEVMGSLPEIDSRAILFLIGWRLGDSPIPVARLDATAC